MKLIACLVVLSVVFAFWSNGFTGSTVSEATKSHVVLEQSFDRLRTPLQRDQSSVAGWWTWDVWAEWLLPSPRRRGRRWRKLYRLLRKLRRWYRQRVQRWCLLRREWRELMEGTSQVEPFVGGSQPRSASPMATPQVPSQEAPSAITAPGTVEETTLCPWALYLGRTGLSATGPRAQPVQRGHLSCTLCPWAKGPRAPSTGPGRPRTIPTDHLCCPGRDCSSYGIFGPHSDHDIVGNGTYTTAHGEKRQMYLCQVCKQPFSETAGTPFFSLKTPMRTLNELVEGLGVRAVARIHHVEPDTVLEWLRKAGQHCEAVSAYIRNWN